MTLLGGGVPTSCHNDVILEKLFGDVPLVSPARLSARERVWPARLVIAGVNEHCLTTDDSTSLASFPGHSLR